MLSPTAHADTDTHKHTFMYIERGPAITASQEKEEWGGGESQWHCLRSTMNILLFDSADVDAYAHAHTLLHV